MTYGCGSDGCVSCYPFIYRCEHGTDFPRPVPNGQPIPDCEEIACPAAGHEDGDGCGIYDTGYRVKTDDGDRAVEDLEIGDWFEDPAYPDDWWQVSGVVVVGDDVHVEVESGEE